MAKYVDETRKAPENWRTYLKESLEIFRVFGWVFRVLVTPEARRQAKIGIAYRLIAMLILALGPMCYGAAIDAASLKEASATRLFIVAFTVIGTISLWFQSRSGKRTERVWNLCVCSVEERTTRMFLSKSLGQHLQEDSKLTIANIEKGIGHAMGGIMALMNNAVPALAELFVGFAFLFWCSPIAGACLSVALIIFVAFHIWMNKRILEVCTPIDAEFRAANRYRYERLENPERVKTSGKEDDDCLKLHAMLSEAALKDFSFWGKQFVVFAFRRGALGYIMSGLAIMYGFHLASSGIWKVGTAAALVYWVNMVRRNLDQIGAIELQLNKATYKVSPMMEALSMPDAVLDKPDAVELDDAPVTVAIEGLTHRYPTGEGEGMVVIKDINFAIAPGEQVALIGESGAGKTTIMRILMRFSDPTEGVVRINGIPLTDIRLHSWQRLMAYVPQQAQIFSGTIGENIRYAMSPEQNVEVGDEDLGRLMRELRLEGERFKDGLATVVGRKGLKLSGGEAQRVMVLSAIARRPRFLIVDEATSSLDSTTEKQVQEAIERAIEASSSAFIIAHRLSTVRRCTKFIVLRPVEEVGEGESQIEAVAASFEELYRISPTFRRLADDQDVSCREAPELQPGVRVRRKLCRNP